MDQLARIKIDETPPGVVAHIGGEIDISNVAAVKRRLTEAVASASPGLLRRRVGDHLPRRLGRLPAVRLARALERRQQRMCVAAPPTTPKTRALLITGFDDIVPVTSTVDAAMEKFDARAPARPA